MKWLDWETIREQARQPKERRNALIVTSAGILFTFLALFADDRGAFSFVNLAAPPASQLGCMTGGVFSEEVLPNGVMNYSGYTHQGRIRCGGVVAGGRTSRWIHQRLRTATGQVFYQELVETDPAIGFWK